MMSTAAAIETTPAATLIRDAATPRPASGALRREGRRDRGPPSERKYRHRLQNWLPSAISAEHVGHFHGQASSR